MIIIDSENPVGTNRIELIYTCINLLPFPMSQMYFYFIFFEVIRLFQKPLQNAYYKYNEAHWSGKSACLTGMFLTLYQTSIVTYDTPISSEKRKTVVVTMLLELPFFYTTQAGILHTYAVQRETQTLFLSFQLCSEIVIMFKRKSQEYFLSNKFMCVLNFLLQFVLYCK